MRTSRLVQPRCHTRRGNVLAWTACAIAVTILIMGFCYWRFYWFDRIGEKGFQGDSSGLRQTVIVPTLNTPIPDGKSAIWCISFQLAWNEFKTKVAKHSFTVAGAEQAAEDLNRAPESLTDVEPDMVYSQAGLSNEGIQETIRAQMQEKFPGVPLPPMTSDQILAVAFAYLSAGVHYAHPYLKNPQEFIFVESAGDRTSVGSFGIPKTNKDVPRELGEQIRVLFAPTEGEELNEFGLDLCRHSQPCQIVLAQLDRRKTLADALAYLQEKIHAFETATVNDPDWRPGEFQETDRLIVPLMHWRIEHHFKELEFRPLVGLHIDGLFFNPAFQMIDFRLNPEGAAVSSSTHLHMAAIRGPRYFAFHRPFLICLKKRQAKHPFFVMWVDNAELMCRQ
jgi:hypothetical protein